MYNAKIIEQELNLSYFELFNLEAALQEVLPRYNLVLSGENGQVRHSLESVGGNIPVRLKGLKLIPINQPSDTEINLDLGTEHGLQLLMSMPSAVNTASRKLLSSLAHDLSRVIRETPPRRFISVEHLESFLGANCEIELLELTDALLWPALQTSEKLFHDFQFRGELSYQYDLHCKPEKMRVESRDGRGRFVNLNIFKVFSKDDVIAAFGIKKERGFDGNHYMLTIFTAPQHCDYIYDIFNQNFERLLTEGAELTGGKFTGEPRLIKLPRQIDFCDLVLDEQAEALVRREIFRFFELESHYRLAGLPYKRGVVLYGPPGTGKTTLAKIILSQVEQTVIWARPCDLVSRDAMERLFWLARVARPSVLILEDVDLYLEDRNYHRGNDFALADIMARLDGLEENDGVLVIMSTNRLEVLEQAIVDRPGRIDSKIYLGELGADKIALLLEKRLGNFPRDFKDFSSIIPPRTRLTGAMAVELCTLVLKMAVENSQLDEILVTQQHIKEALREVEPANRQVVVGFTA
jgi:AAA+ superfamily predicted ATPase